MLGEMLRSTRGSNQFGSAIKVTIDGRLNATGIAVRGRRHDLRPAQELDGGRRAASAATSIVGADKALRFLGSARAGAAGGVIDNTLGNALGIVGQRRHRRRQLC